MNRDVLAILAAINLFLAIAPPYPLLAPLWYALAFYGALLVLIRDDA